MEQFDEIAIQVDINLAARNRKSRPGNAFFADPMLDYDVQAVGVGVWAVLRL